MRWQFVSYHAAAAEGTAAGRQLWAVGEALRALGHDVQAWSWGPQRPATVTADWCERRPLPDEPMWRSRARSLVRPRAEVVRARWHPAAPDVVVADDPASWAAVAGARDCTRVSMVHFAVRLDQRALRDRAPARIQDRRAERRAVSAADVAWALSDRVRDAVGASVVVPATLPVPDAPLPLVDEPTVGLLADWSWPPNLAAADDLLRVWPTVCDRVPGARLLLAGRGSSPIGSLAGTQWLGEVPTTEDLLRELAVFAFPCPPTSGPKLKVMDAMAHGVPVLTYPTGVEGISGGTEGTAVVTPETLTDRLVRLLRDQQERAAVSAAGRSAIVDGHSPRVAAQARIRSVAAATAR